MQLSLESFKKEEKKRMLSPSAINTYLQCPRKFYYSYIRKLRRLPSIHTVRGSIVHAAIEDFFNIDINKISNESFGIEMEMILLDYFEQHWKRSGELKYLNLKQEELDFFHQESVIMLKNWFNKLYEKFAKFEDKKQAFLLFRPESEVTYTSQILSVKGIIDAIHRFEDGTVLMDYKTSSKDTFTEEYKLQLAIYALLYKEANGKEPKKVGLSFLKFGEKYLDVDENLLNLAKKEIAFVHAMTRSENIGDYKKNITPLCKWATGQCDFYGTCIKEP